MKKNVSKFVIVPLLTLTTLMSTGISSTTVAFAASKDAVDTSDINGVHTAVTTFVEYVSDYEMELYNSTDSISLKNLETAYNLLETKLENNEKDKETAKKKYQNELKKKQEEEKKKKIQQLRNKIVKSALSKLGCKYVWGATGPNSFDCSGLTQWAMKQNGISIPRVAADQAQAGTKISKDELQPGDLIFFRTDKKDKNRISHVGMYIGNGLMVHAPHTGDVVKISSINTASRKRTYAWACTYIKNT